MHQALQVVGVVVVVVGWMLLITAAARQVDARGGNGGLVGAAMVLCLPVGILLWFLAFRSRPSASPNEVDA